MDLKEGKGGSKGGKKPDASRWKMNMYDRTDQMGELVETYFIEQSNHKKSQGLKLS